MQLNFKKSLLIASFGHILIFGYVVAQTQDKTEIVKPPHSQIPLVTESHIIAKSVSNKEIDEVVAQFDANKRKMEERENKAAEAVKKISREYENTLKAIKKAQKDLRSVNKKIQNQKEDLENLKKKEARELAQRKAREKVEELKKKKEIARLKKKKEEARAVALNKTKEENLKLLKKIKMENIRKQERYLAKLRGVYEREIYDTFVDNWVLPYIRSNVNCKVEISIDSSGLIIAHRFLSRCNEMYIRSIDDAIRKTAFLPTKSVPVEVFKRKEIVNFIDSADGLIVR